MSFRAYKMSFRPKWRNLILVSSYCAKNCHTVPKIVILSGVQRSREDLIDSTAVIPSVVEGPHYKHRLFAKHTDRHSCHIVILSNVEESRPYCHPESVVEGSLYKHRLVAKHTNSYNDHWSIAH